MQMLEVLVQPSTSTCMKYNDRVHGITLYSSHHHMTHDTQTTRLMHTGVGSYIQLRLQYNRDFTTFKYQYSYYSARVRK